MEIKLFDSERKVMEQLWDKGDRTAKELADNLGYYVEIDFLIGTQNIVTRGGILYAVGNNYVTLYQDLEDRYVVCDLYSIKFVTFYNTRSTPRSRGTINAPAGNAGSRSM